MRGGAVTLAVAALAVAGCTLAATGLMAPSETTSTPDAAPPDLRIDSSSREPIDAGGDAGDDDDNDDAAPDSEADAARAPIDACTETTNIAAIDAINRWPADLPVPTIDGQLSDWPCDGRIDLSDANAAYILDSSHPLAARIQVRWDAQHIYMAIQVTDATVGGTDLVNPYNNDSVEVYVSADATLNGDYDAYTHQYITDWKGLVVDYGPSHTGAASDTTHAGFVAASSSTASSPTPGGWTFEASLARPTLYATAGDFTLGTNLALDFEVNDGSGLAQVATVILTMAPAQIACTCTQACCCGKTPDIPYCDSARIGRVTLE